jgi:hypothetical protein
VYHCGVLALSSRAAGRSGRSSGTGAGQWRSVLASDEEREIAAVVPRERARVMPTLTGGHHGPHVPELRWQDLNAAGVVPHPDRHGSAWQAW